MKCQRCGKENPAEVHTCTPLALKLADALEQQFPLGTAQHYLDGEAAAELRRLHDEVELQQCSLNVARQMIEGYVEWVRKDEALLQRALDTLEELQHATTDKAFEMADATIAALKERLK